MEIVKDFKFFTLFSINKYHLRLKGERGQAEDSRQTLMQIRAELDDLRRENNDLRGKIQANANMSQCCKNICYFTRFIKYKVCFLINEMLPS